MYYFGLGRAQAARAWWERALRLDPKSSRAREMIFALDRTEAKLQGRAPPSDTTTSTSVYPPYVPTPNPVTPAASPRASRASTLIGAPLAATVTSAAVFSASPVLSQPKDFDVTIDEPVEALPEPEISRVTPWDDGPSQTEVVTLNLPAEDGDALATDTAAPALDRDPLFVKPPDEDAIAGALVHLEPDERAEHHAVADHPPQPEPKFTPSQIPDIDPQVLLKEATARMQLDDFEGALRLLERMPPDDPHFTRAKESMARARERLQERFESKLGSLHFVPQILLPEQEVMWLSLNHRAGFLLSQIDGNVTYEDLLSLSGMPRLDTLRLLVGLIGEGVIGRRVA